ncbi:MAG: hypothetical protein KAT68_02060 [Bacteroidales bacterium]|nr:hypothetical protein [Bacteroidales bacterium]
MNIIKINFVLYLFSFFILFTSCSKEDDVKNDKNIEIKKENNNSRNFSSNETNLYFLNGEYENAFLNNSYWNSFLSGQSGNIFVNEDNVSNFTFTIFGQNYTATYANWYLIRIEIYDFIEIVGINIDSGYVISIIICSDIKLGTNHIYGYVYNTFTEFHAYSDNATLIITDKTEELISGNFYFEANRYESSEIIHVSGEFIQIKKYNMIY